MLRLGAHVSISGGFDKAVDRQVELGGTSGQLFVGSPRGWKVNDVDEADAKAFREATIEADIGPWIVHGTYLINLATPKEELAEKSVRTVQAELDAAAMLGIPYYTFHPGAHTGAGEEQGISNVARRLSQLDIPEDVTLLLENTAGSGTTIGRQFRELDSMIAQSDHGYPSVGVCLDSCHLFAAGYDFRTPEDAEAMIAELDDTIGRENVHYLHLNDSKHPFGSKKDEHEHIGEGDIGEDGFRVLINQEAFSDLPMVLETPVDEKGYEWNIGKVRELRASS